MASQRYRLSATLIAAMAPGLLVVILVLFHLWKLRRQIASERQQALKSQREAEQADEDMSLFMHSMNHEIRTPLNAIIGFTELLNQTKNIELDPEERTQLMNGLHRQTQNIQTMVNTILDISKMESGTYIFQPEPTQLYVLAQVALDSLRDTHPEGVEMRCEVEPSEQEYMLDNNRILVVLTQLLRNAQKYTTSGSITLRMQASDNVLRIDVEDTGCGIPSELQSRIWERFTKGDPFSEGFGLGLPLSKVIVEKMGGRLWLVRSDSNGSHFAVELPC